MKHAGLEQLRRTIARAAEQLLRAHGLAPRRKRRAQTSARNTKPERPLAVANRRRRCSPTKTESSHQIESAQVQSSPPPVRDSAGRASPGNVPGLARAGEQFSPPPATEAAPRNVPAALSRPAARGIPRPSRPGGLMHPPVIDPLTQHDARAGYEFEQPKPRVLRECKACCGVTGMKCRLLEHGEKTKHRNERGEFRVVAVIGQTYFAGAELRDTLATAQPGSFDPTDALRRMQ